MLISYFHHSYRYNFFNSSSTVKEGLDDFNVTPQWINVGYVDCTAGNATHFLSLGTPSLPSSRSANYLRTRLKNHGGLISSIVNKDKEVEIVYHNIRSISSNCDNDNAIQGNASTSEFFNGNKYVLRENFALQPSSLILRGHLLGKSGFSLTPLRPLGITILASNGFILKWRHRKRLQFDL